MTARPRIRQFIFKAGEAKVSGKQSQRTREKQTRVRNDIFDGRRCDVTNSSQNRTDSAVNGGGVFLFIRPNLFQSFFVQKHGSKIRLRVQVNGKNGYALIREYPREVIDEGSFPD